MVKVLVWGYNDGACAIYRGQMYTEPLAALGVEMRYVDALHQEIEYTDLDDKPLKGVTWAQVRQMLHENQARMHVSIDATAIEWADVVLFRRYYNTHFRCALPQCDFRTFSPAEMDAHPHPVKMQEESPGRPARDDITTLIWRAAEGCDNTGIIYDSDDLLIGPALSRWNGFWPDVLIQQSQIGKMVRRADLVTVATPTLARYFSNLNPNTRVIRNSINPDLYKASVARPAGDLPRVLYYGQAARLRDYAGYPDDITVKWDGGYARWAVEEHRKGLRRVFMGAKPGEETRIISKYFDEVLPYAEIANFPQALSNAYPDIGLAPLGGDKFDQGKSELHWLEYSLAGAATIAYRYNNDGPYNMIRDGVDGVLARGRQEWSDGMKWLLDPSFREDIAAAAKERVLREYDYRNRAQEWADAFRWAAEHPGYHANA
jgi:hypothetical protein